MPPFLPVILAGAAMFAAYKWARREVSRSATEAKRAAEEMSRRAGVPCDLGDLEYDAVTGVYCPKRSS